MTQDSGRKPTNNRRSTRGRNRPLLVTSTENEVNGQVADEATPTLEESAAEVQAQNPPVKPIRRRLPSFFSTVGKSTPASTPQEKEVAQARIARATRGKLASAKTSDDAKGEASETAVEPKKVRAKPTAPAR